MSYESNIQNKVAKIESHLEELFKINADIDRLTRLDLGSEINFLESENLFRRIFDLLLPMQSLDLSTIPFSLLKKLEEELHDLVNFINKILSFKVLDNNSPKRERDSIINRLENNTYPELVQAILPILSFLQFYKKIDYEVKDEIRLALNELNEMKEELRQKGAEMLSESESTLEKLRSAAGSTGINQYSKIFSEQACIFKKSAKIWLRWAIALVIAISIIGLVFLAIGLNVKVESTFEIVQYSITKILILTSLFYALNLCLKNYKSHKHNEIINQHRQNSLNTFEAFVKSAGDDTQTKSAVLLEATRTIFSSNQTGYLNNENESEMPNRIIEIIKSSEPK